MSWAFISGRHHRHLPGSAARGRATVGGRRAATRRSGHSVMPERSGGKIIGPAAGQLLVADEMGSGWTEYVCCEGRPNEYQICIDKNAVPSGGMSGRCMTDTGAARTKAPEAKELCQIANRLKPRSETKRFKRRALYSSSAERCE